MSTAADTMHDPIGQSAFADSSFADTPRSHGNVSGGGIAKSLSDQAGSLKDQAADRLRAFADEGKSHVTATLDGVVTAAREIADKLGDGAFGPVGGYAKDAADAVETWANGIKDKSIDELLDDGRHLVRAQPAIAVGVAVVAGFILSRFLKAGSV